MADLIVKSAVKGHLDDWNVAADFYDALDEEVAELFRDVAQRAEDKIKKRFRPAICRSVDWRVLG